MPFVPDVPDALAVKSGFFARHRRLVPADTIAEVDSRSRVVGLRVARESIRRFLAQARRAGLIPREPALEFVT